MRIQQLSPHVANQIAAGEVIERPASVVKELLENAVDAGANAIYVEIGFGGLNLIKISDNGAGIVEEDLILAISPHATSKISQLQDLYHLDSMGFRGEALASIASVSRLRLSSKPAHQTNAMLLQIDENGTRLSPIARNQGTTVEVADLFYNAPVRKKFLKSERSEFQAIEMVVKRFALSAPTISLNLKHNGKEVLALPAVNCEHSERLRIKKLLGKNFIDEAIYVQTEYENIQLRGWTSSASYQRSQRDKQWVYLNRRMIQDRLLQHAIQQAYQPLLHPGRFASCLLYLTISPEQIDVNVHPTKHEVRFQSPRTIHDFMVSSLSQAIEMKSTLSDLTSASGTNEFEHANTSSVDLSSKIFDVMQISLPQKANIEYAKPQETSTLVLKEYETPTKSTAGHLNSWYVINPSFVLISPQIGHTYLVNVERAYQALCRAQLMMYDDALPHRPLLVPLSIPIQKKQYTLLERLQPFLQNFGIHFDFLSETALLIRSVPQCLPQLNLTQLFEKLMQSESELTDTRQKDQSIANVNQADTNLLQNLFQSNRGAQEDVWFEIVMTCQSFNAYACQVDDKLELLDFIQQQAFPTEYCRHLDRAACLRVMSHA